MERSVSKGDTVDVTYETTGVVVADSFGITKRLQQRIRL